MVNSTMIIFPVISLVGCIAYLLMGVYGLKLNKKSSLNHVFFIISVSGFLWAFGISMFYLSADETECWAWFTRFCIGFFMFPAAVLHFTLVMTKKTQGMRAWWPYVLLYIPGIFFTLAVITGLGPYIVRGFERNASGWHPVYATDHPMYWVLNTYSAVYTITGIISIFRWRKRANSKREKKQGTVILRTAVPCFVLSYVSGYILPQQNIYYSPPVVPILVMIWLAGIWYAMSRYRLMALTPAIAADSIISKIWNLVLLINPDGRIIKLNSWVEKLLGYTKNELIGRHFSVLVDQVSMNEILSLHSESEEPIPKEIDFRDKKGIAIPFRISASPVQDEAGELIGFVIAGQDLRQTKALQQEIEERKHVEEKLAQETERLSVTLRSIQEGVITTNNERRILLMNKAAERLTGYTLAESEGKSVLDILSFKHLQGSAFSIQDILADASGKATPVEAILISKTGKECMISCSIHPIYDADSRNTGLIIALRDITESRKIEEIRQRNQRLESLGLLAGGIAHDFNNILTSIVGNISLAKINMDEDDPALPILRDAEAASMRARDLTQELLTFSRRGNPIKKVSNISNLLQEIVPFLIRGSNVQCTCTIQPDLWNTEIDPSQMNQVINNLIINALQAMPNGGMLDISAENIDNAMRLIPQNTNQHNRFIRIVIKDTGIGIPPENIEKIFDPYFTTKPTGTGIGLSIVYSIIKNHNGYIFVESVPTKGTNFSIYLPASDSCADMEKKPRLKPFEGNQKILLMDDNEMIVRIATKMLEHLGFQAEGAREGREAIQKYKSARESSSPFDVVIMDLTVPGGMGGKEAIRYLLQYDPQANVIVSSGYSNDPILSDYEKYGFKGAVNKPYSLETLSQAIGSVLSSSEQKPC